MLQLTTDYMPRTCDDMLREIDLEIRVRYQETDAMGVLHHANYFTYFEMGRTELLRSTGKSYRQLEDDGTLMVIVKIGCKYLRPARYDDLLRLRTRTIRVTAAKIEHAYQLFRGDELLAEGDSTLACVDRSGRVQRTPEWLRFEDGDGE
jgi:acyl-CoA thioester hydrolase